MMEGKKRIVRQKGGEKVTRLVFIPREKKEILLLPKLFFLLVFVWRKTIVKEELI